MILDLDPERFWLITPRLALFELEAAEERARRNQSLAITAAWIGAALQRSKKLPKLRDLTERKPRNGLQALQMYMGQLRATLPAITLAEWQARQAR